MTDAHLLYIMATNDYHILPLALLNRDYCRRYHESVLRSHTRKVVSGANIEYYLCDQLHRPDGEGPAVDIDCSNQYRIQNEKIWYCHGMIYRSKGPAKITTLQYPGRSEIYRIEYTYRNGKPYKDKHFVNDVIERRFYEKDNELHHLTKPAVTHYRGGKLYGHLWKRCGKVYRENGPANIVYDENGVIVFSE